MRLLGLAATLLSCGAIVSAADCVSVALSVIPSCAQGCFLNGAPSVGCGGTDFVCQCNEEAKLYAAIEGCVSSACPSASYQAVIDGASTVCNCATGGPGPATTPEGGGSGITTSAGEGSVLTGSLGSSPPNTVNTVIPNTVLPQTVLGSPPKATASTGGESNGKPLPSPTRPSITTATNASSWAAPQYTVRLFFLLGVTSAIACVMLVS